MITMTVTASVPACQDLFLLLTESLYLLDGCCLCYGANQGRNLGVLSCECNKFQWDATECGEYTKGRITWRKQQSWKTVFATIFQMSRIVLFLSGSV